MVRPTLAVVAPLIHLQPTGYARARAGEVCERTHVRESIGHVGRAATGGVAMQVTSDWLLIHPYSVQVEAAGHDDLTLRCLQADMLAAIARCVPFTRMHALIQVCSS